MNGKVKWFSDSKGYGFITPEDGSKEVFVHHSAIVMDGRRTLEEYQEVQYDAIKGPKGMAAENVKLV